MVKTKCDNCGKDIKRNPREIKKYKHSFCTQECRIQYIYNKYILRWKTGLEVGYRGKMFNISNHIRKYLFNKYNNRCAKCGWSKINIVTGNIPLEIHHIDGNCKNNNEVNLILLCPNCHALTPNHKSLNKNSKRNR